MFSYRNSKANTNLPFTKLRLHKSCCKTVDCCFSKLRQPTGQRLSNVKTQQTKISIGPILFLYHEESILSSNLNSKELRFHGAHLSMYIIIL